MTLPFDDRYWLALEATTMRFEERDEFISDDDLLDIADAWTTDPEPDWDADEIAERPDRMALLEALYAAIVY